MEHSLPQLILPIKMEKSEERLTSLGGLVVVSRQNRVRLKIESDSLVRQCVDVVNFPLYVLNPCPSIRRLRARIWRSLFLVLSINNGVGRATSHGLVERLS